MRYKLAILWADGLYQGFVGVGSNEDHARDKALLQAFEAAQEKGIGFKVIKPADVPFLSDSDKRMLEAYWEREIRKLDRDW